MNIFGILLYKQGLLDIQQKNHKGNENDEDEFLDFGFEKFSKEIPKDILPLDPKEVLEIVEQEPASPSTPGTSSVVEDLADISTSLDSKSHEKKGPSSMIKLNHPPEVIVGNMN